MNEGTVLRDLYRPREALARYRYVARIYRTLIGEGQSQYRIISLILNFLVA